ncbi:MAG: GNAT family N-acetyltransferase [Candidatus Marinimicrobia bacterium]|nr:GNAT family N-acetyltransferase [Candidatus Neomarinimicrobiota bacterium]
MDKEYYDIQGAYGYNGVIASNYSNSFRKSFYEEFSKYCLDNNIIAEFTRFSPILGNHQFSENYMEVIYDRDTMFLNLDQPYDVIWSTQYSSKNRNMIRKGRKKLYCNISQDRSLIGSFKQIYNETMQKIGADDYYYFSDEYFDNILFGKNYIINVYDSSSEELQAAMILMIHGNYAHYHLSGRSKNCNNNATSNLMLDEAIRFAQKKECKFFHFGGGNSTEKDDSLLKFKQSFSKDNCQFFIGKKIHNEKIYNNVVKQWEERIKNADNRRLLRYREIDER